MVAAPAGERDLARVAAQVVAALGEHQTGPAGEAEQGDQDRGVGLAVGVDRLGRRGGEQRPAQRLRRLRFSPGIDALAAHIPIGTIAR
jgi:hypothetical protein